MGVTVRQITNANIVLEGVGQAGKASEVNLPEVVQKYIDHVALGMLGTLELPAGVEKLTGTIKWNSIYPDVTKQMASPNKVYSIQVRANSESHNAGGLESEQLYAVFIQARFAKVPLGNLKQNEKSEHETEMKITYVRAELNGEELLEFDVFNNTYRAGGEDVSINFRTNLGA